MLQHQTSRPSTKTTQNTMVKAPKQNLPQKLAAEHVKLTKCSTCRRNQLNEGGSSSEAETFQAHEGFRSLPFGRRLAAEIHREMHLVAKK